MQTRPSLCAAAKLPLVDADCYLLERFLSPAAAATLLTTLQAKVHWQQPQFTLFGQRVLAPRLCAWYGDPAAVYTYSGQVNRPLAWLLELRTLKAQLENFTQAEFNSVLINRYRHGRDSLAWHSDDEPELGPKPLLASLSLGQTRRFLMRHKTQKTLPTHKLDLHHGSLLIMRGSTQQHWQHALSKTQRTVAERINLTYRLVISD